MCSRFQLFSLDRSISSFLSDQIGVLAASAWRRKKKAGFYDSLFLKNNSATLPFLVIELSVHACMFSMVPPLLFSNLESKDRTALGIWPSMWLFISFFLKKCWWIQSRSPLVSMFMHGTLLPLAASWLWCNRVDIFQQLVVLVLPLTQKSSLDSFASKRAAAFDK